MATNDLIPILHTVRGEEATDAFRHWHPSNIDTKSHQRELVKLDAYTSDQAGGSISYTYDAHGQLDSINSSYYAPGTGLALTYDANGNKTSETFPDGSVATYTYDAENRMASYELKKDGVLLTGETYRYDATGNRTAAFTYRFGDDFTSAPQAPGWLESSSAPWSQVPEGGGYIYQASSQSGTATSVHQDASLMNCSFQARVMITGTGAADANAGISIRSDGGAGSFGPNQYYFSLYPAGAAACWKLWEITQNSPVVVAGGDIAIELNRYYTLKATVEALDASTLRISVFIDGALLAAYNDSSPRTGTGVGLRAGNATARFDDARADGLTAYTYDTADQLIKIRKSDNSTITNTFDANGNRTQVTDSTGVASYSYTYNAANQLTAIKNASGTVIHSFTYDAAGNTITGENATYTHNAQNRLTQVVIANVTYSYAYNAQGRLISRETLGSPLAKTYYRFNEVTGALMHELDINGNITVSYVSDSSGRIISVTRAQNTLTPTTFFYHYNAHGDVSAISDSSGSVIASFSYDSWGVPTEKDANGNPVALIGTWTQTTGGTPGQGLFFLFGGMLYDAAAGLYLTRTRAYNPRTGRFLERDILDESGKKGVYAGFPFGKDAIGTNLYAWCGNNPVTRVDPSGRSGHSEQYSYIDHYEEVYHPVGRWVEYCRYVDTSYCAWTPWDGWLYFQQGYYVLDRYWYDEGSYCSYEPVYAYASRWVEDPPTTSRERILQNYSGDYTYEIAESRLMFESNAYMVTELENIASAGGALAAKKGADSPSNDNYDLACWYGFEIERKKKMWVIVGVPRFSPFESDYDKVPLPEWCDQKGFFNS